MTPKEKAGDLVKKYAIKLPYDYKGRTDKVSGLKIHEYNIDLAKQCALIAVDEMLDFRNGLYINEGSLAHKYLLDIKHEIEKL